jgi:hypothetical protein
LDVHHDHDTKAVVGADPVRRDTEDMSRKMSDPEKPEVSLRP